MSSTRWLVLEARVPSAELRDELAEGLLASGGAAVQESDDLLTTYVPEPSDPEPFVARATERLSERLGTEVEILWRWQEDEDWSSRWKEGLGPREVGSRITVTQPWNPVRESGDRIVIVIEPASAFGTGEHATTRGALRLMQRHLESGAEVLDVGAGSAILSIAAARLGAATVLAAESDAGSIGTARENLERNGVGERVRLVHQRVSAEWLRSVREGGFDLIAANVLSGVLVPLLPPLADALCPDGALILGGILDTEADEVVAAADAVGLDPAEVDREGEWWTGLLRRR